MFKRLTYLILFLSLSGLLFASEQKVTSLSLATAKGIRTTANKEKNTSRNADDYLSIDFRTNYYFIHNLNDKQSDYGHLSTYAYLFLKENALSAVFVQKTLNFFKSQCIYLLNCIWLI
ncbi:hypothetical protein [Emticicia sp. C21]|uniref:hypothetical protein n=1 Tax=Emticicia sp. C21 TaxID=2302915 RepID=UPI000E34BD7E|nr:hypothetical protein [Emticicia sp. C21]RFS16631.1 hypothetical protein D0T08_08065 [Emticicia sp. C21]